MKKSVECSGCTLERKSTSLVTITPPANYENIKLMVQGDLPSQEALDDDRPFSGRTGFWLIKNWLGNAGLYENNVLFDNTIRCRPSGGGKDGPYPKNSKKSTVRDVAEAHCNTFSVWGNVPSNIPLLALGREAANQLVKVDNISDWNGHIEQRDGRITGVTYHPGSVMKNPNLLPLVVKHTQNILDAARNPSILDRPEVKKGWTPYKPQEVVADLEWEYDAKTKVSGRVTVVGLAYDSHVGFSSFNVDEGLGVIERHFADGNRVIGHNFISADMLRLGGTPKSWGPDHIIDTQIVAHLIHKHWAELGLFGLGDLVKYYDATTDWKRDKGDTLAYNGRDVAYNFKLWEGLQIDLTLTGQWHLVEKQQRLARMASLMHARGLRIDSEAIRTFNEQWKSDRGTAKSSLPFNPQSPKQVIAWFAERGIKLPNTTAATIKKYAGKFPEIAAMMEFKEAGKGLKSWYDDEAIELGYIYPEHKVTGTAVTRFSSAGPNVQNIPPWAKFAILPFSDDEYVFNSDAKNLEGRTVAFHAQDNQMLSDFSSGMDIHSIVASRVFNVPLSTIGRKSDERQVGKTVVHASNYMEGPYNLANRLYGNVKRDSIKKAEAIQRAYFKAYPKTHQWHKTITAQLDRGDIGVRDAHGSLRFIYAQDSHERAKRGTHYLGCSSGAGLVNQKALDVWSDLGLLPMLLVHDSLTYSLPKGEEGKKLEGRINEILEAPLSVFENRVDFPWESSTGSHYGDLH